MIEGIVWISLLAVMLYSFWIKGWSKVWDERVVSFFIDIDKKDLPAVTMIIPFRNEELNLPNLLGAINCFDYPVDLLELIFVNDHSEDASVSLVQNCKLKYPYKLIHSDEEGKKSAISKGVVLAKNTWIVTTDVDTVWGEQSLRHLMSHPKLHEVEMICGVVEMIPQNGALLHQLQSLEYSILQAAGISSLFRFEPLLNSGANLAFRKYSFIELGGYSSNQHIASGDDTFLMLSFAKQWNDGVVSNPCSIVKTTTVASWREYFMQRNRWGKKVQFYSERNIKQAGILFFLANLSMLFLMLLSFTSFYYLLIYVVAALFRFFAEYALLTRFYNYYKQKLSASSVLVLTILYPIVFILTVLFGVLIKPRWKGRDL